MEQKRILLLGVGNILYSDEGIGVHAVRHLDSTYTFSPNLTLVEGGTMGKMLMPQLMDCDIVIILDAVLGGGDAGTIYRLEGDALRKSLGFHDSQHQVDLVDTLISCDLAGHRPEAVVIGMEPSDWKSMHLECTPIVQEQFPRFIRLALEELHAQGGTATLKQG